jgi:extracellular factor (EF) 3-hydroxypalmitic acid methyl ester biosynthesis protein
MQQAPIELKASLAVGDKKIPVEARYASKYSLLIRFYNGNYFRDGTEFSELTIKVNGSSEKLGRCRLISEPNIDGFAGRITFVDDVYDLQSLIFDHKVVRLQSAFFNIPMILCHKQDIRAPFKDYTADLTYDLNVYKSLFDKLDSEHAEEPSDVKQAVQQAIINTEGRRFMGFLDQRLTELERLVSDFSREEHERHGFYFRKQLWPFILCSPFMARTNLKPRGYAGDSEMMSMIYSNGYWGDSTFAKLMHKHPVEHPAAQAVRNRRVFIAGKLPQLKGKFRLAQGERLKALSVACGPACEIQDVLLSEGDFERYHFSLLDQDRHALLEAAKSVDRIEKKSGLKVKVEYLNESVRTMLTSPKLKSRWGQFHFIYSMGLFDYLTPPVAKAVLSKLYQLLEPGGEMVIGNFHASNSSRTYMEYWLDWVLYYRTERDFIDLFQEPGSADTEVVFDDTGVQMFLHIRKREDSVYH